MRLRRRHALVLVAVVTSAKLVAGCGLISGIDALVDVDEASTPDAANDAAAADAEVREAAGTGFCAENAPYAYCNDFEAIDSASKFTYAGPEQPASDDHEAHGGSRSLRLITDMRGSDSVTLIAPAITVEGTLTFSLWWKRLDDTGFVTARLRTANESVTYVSGTTGSHVEVRETDGTLRTTLAASPDVPPAERFNHVEISIRKLAAAGAGKASVNISVLLDGAPMPTPASLVIDPMVNAFVVQIANYPLGDGGRIWIDDVLVRQN